MVISAWINDESFSLKMYDIMNMQNGEGIPKFSYETFTITADTCSIRCLFNPKLQLKQYASINEKDEVVGQILAV